ncbi:hypothetical protein KMC57_gp24 [Achromobacter phage vB_AxyP_19-32_Axy24]|uniref:Uncharacterized protein n=1 Tax=Achromobacter phage vB_AxyP_19-32_Axy24 TaxID=2591048 RepID=A0A514CWA9_9CAUD|nr:hypothetical protein KMC57_gp24 [Achromobacter phage vB_AxyP_19-32_Axy24]QDH84742.1 hypothetical protein Axy24_024 [Achromobacter phage vB_AxyP_19-32_Axy24]
MTENNAAQPVLTDDEVRAIITDAHQSHGAFKTGYGLSLGRAIEQAVLSKLRAPVTDERVLPTLPVAWGSAINDAGDDHVDLYSAEQMQEYARAALASTPVAAIPPEKPLPDLMMATYHEAVGWNACRAAMLRSMPLASAPVADDWTPTPANINALPERVRAYIHDLVANADPSGMVAENTLLRDQTKQLDAMIGRLKRELASAPVAGEAKNYPGDDVGERLDNMADDQPPGSQAQSDLYAAATIWRKHIAHRAAPQASEAVRPCTCQPDWGAKK